MTATTLDTSLPLDAAPASASAFARGAVGGPRTLLRLEGAAAFAAAVAAYLHLGGGWPFFAAMILVPDLSLLGYLAGPRIGALVYNAGHSYLAPAALAVLSWALGAETALLVATIWIAHVGMDRAAGYGLKYVTAFGDTHLGRIGRLGAQRTTAIGASVSATC